VQFFIVYIREAHALDSRAPMTFGSIEDPVDLKERTLVASKCVKDLDLPMEALVDRLDDAVNQAYGGWPDRLYLVGRDGKIAYAGGKGPAEFRPDELEKAIERELAVGKTPMNPPAQEKKP
jgi:hypothetical protein